MSSTVYDVAGTLAGPPAAVTNQLNYVLSILAWLVTAAGVCGLLLVGSRMAISLRSGEGDEHLSQFVMVLGACVIGATAGPIVAFVM
ncbi:MULTISPECIES: hypothetical protein [Streptomyces]|uniref:Putative membrane protein n=1 Tax=Streptomyces scabiei (strain 87.22) TaxID=680198 RepID=C9YXS4_STRSW|nr:MULTISPECIES: hypothetical protein [Streptomyces]MBP5861852.1 hypothetical protein [Streptomyces sp. LBUM 1484]MBP5869201.1 hypothetical protein [Streptomyces sp. LBUM 1485]MBP5907669.1 hypothetical protein [Streptomyces sp. LBUM 1478]MBP5929409.1 hypothetical protein [Streptomyces sp. LBUM 1479]KFG09746.1 hypothetical protein IQ61_06595 [Streptomyces scabiei]